MPDNNAGPATLFAMLALLLMLGMTGFIAWRAGAFGNMPGSDATAFDLNLRSK